MSASTQASTQGSTPASTPGSTPGSTQSSTPASTRSLTHDSSSKTVWWIFGGVLFLLLIAGIMVAVIIVSRRSKTGSGSGSETGSGSDTQTGSATQTGSGTSNTKKTCTDSCNSKCKCPKGTECDSNSKTCKAKAPEPCGSTNCIGDTKCDYSTISCVCSGSCTDSKCTCPNGTVCNKKTSICEIPVKDNKEVYFYDVNRYGIPQLTTGDNSVNRNFDNMKANKATADSLGAVQATKEQLIAEWKNGLDSCNYGWVYNNPLKEDSNIYLPYRTTRGKDSGCENKDVLSGEIPSASGLQGTEKWGMYLYGVKPKLPDCNSGVASGTPCVANYAPGKFSKFS